MHSSESPQSGAPLRKSGTHADDNAPAEARRRAILELARKHHEEDGQVEIDDNAQLSEGNDNGCYVQAWVWVDFNDTPFDKKKGDTHE